MYPIPTHLEKIMIPMGEQNDAFFVQGNIQCCCGCDNFLISFFGNVERESLRVQPYENGWNLVIKVVCKNCNRSYILFDDSKYGYNGFCCHEGVPVPDNELIEWHCTKCGSTAHSLMVSIDSQGKEDFLEEGLPYSLTECTEDDWVNAFESICIDLKCSECGQERDHWVSYETM